MQDEYQRAMDAVLVVESDAIKHGAIDGSRRWIATAAKLGEAIARFRATIFEKWTAYFKPRLSALRDDERWAHIAPALAVLDAFAAELERQLGSRPKFHGVEANAIADLRQVATRERSLLQAELNLYANHA